MENEGYLSKQGVMKLRSAIARDIFAQDLLCVYDQQTAYRNELRQVSREKVEELVGQIRAGQYDGAGLDMLLLKLAQRLSRTKGKKVYGYLSAGTKKLVDSIVDDLAADSRIAELYDLWYEQRERIIQTYSQKLPEREPLSKNGDFKAVRNAVIKAAVEMLKMAQLPQKELAKQVEITSPVLVQSLALLRQTARIFEDRLQEYYAPQIAHTDRKLLSKIAEKKLAQGQKLGG